MVAQVLEGALLTIAAAQAGIARSNTGYSVFVQDL